MTLTLIDTIDLLGTFVFAFTGAAIGKNIKFDFFGMLFLAFLTAVGGGTTRDIIMGQQVFWTDQPIYLYTVLISTFICFITYNIKYKNLLLFLDTLGLGTFTIIGTQKALVLNFNIESSVILGLISGVLGGIIRGVFSKEKYIIFKKEVYATTSVLTALVYTSLSLKINNTITCYIISIFICFLVRYLSIKYKVHLPRAR